MRPGSKIGKIQAKILDINGKLAVVNQSKVNLVGLNKNELKEEEIYSPTEGRLFEKYDDDVTPLYGQTVTGSYKINNKEHTTTILYLDETTGVVNNTTLSPTIEDEYENQVVLIDSNKEPQKAVQYVTNHYLLKNKKNLKLIDKLPLSDTDPRNIALKKNGEYTFKMCLHNFIYNDGFVMFIENINNRDVITSVSNDEMLSIIRYSLKGSVHGSQFEKVLQTAAVIKQNKLSKELAYHTAFKKIAKEGSESMNLLASVDKKTNDKALIYSRDNKIKDIQDLLDLLKTFK